MSATGHVFPHVPPAANDATCVDCGRVFPIVKSFDNLRGILIPMGGARCLSGDKVVPIPTLTFHKMIQTLTDAEDDLAVRGHRLATREQVLEKIMTVAQEMKAFREAHA